MADKYLEGFDLKSDLIGGLKKGGVTTAVTIAKGDALSWAAGYLSLATALDSTFAGIASHDADNADGASGAIDVLFIPPLPAHSFRVQVESDAVLTVADNRGGVYDLESEDGIDLADSSVTAFGFKVDEIDISAKSIAANAFGHAIGHFEAIT